MGSEAAGLAPLVSALPTPAAVIDGTSGRVVVVNQLFAALFPRLLPTDVPVDAHAGADRAPGDGAPQEELCRGCGQLAELELRVTDHLHDGDASVVLVTCGAGTASALEIELRGLLADVEESVLLVGDDLRVRFASESDESITGRSGVDSPVAELFDEADRDDIARLVADALLQPGRRLVSRGRLIEPSGSVRWVEAIARGMAAGTAPGGVVVGLRTLRGTSHLGVVASSPPVSERLDPEQFVEAFRALTPSEKAEVIRRLRS